MEGEDLAGCLWLSRDMLLAVSVFRPSWICSTCIFICKQSSYYKDNISLHQYHHPCKETEPDRGCPRTLHHLQGWGRHNHSSIIFSPAIIVLFITSFLFKILVPLLCYMLCESISYSCFVIYLFTLSYMLLSYIIY